MASSEGTVIVGSPGRLIIVKVLIIQITIVIITKIMIVVTAVIVIKVMIVITICRLFGRDFGAEK